MLETLVLDVDAAFDYDAWWARVESLQSSIRTRLGEGETVGALLLVDELRDEEL